MEEDNFVLFVVWETFGNFWIYFWKSLLEIIFLLNMKFDIWLSSSVMSGATVASICYVLLVKNDFDWVLFFASNKIPTEYFYFGASRRWKIANWADVHQWKTHIKSSNNTLTRYNTLMNYYHFFQILKYAHSSHANDRVSDVIAHGKNGTSETVLRSRGYEISDI